MRRLIVTPARSRPSSPPLLPGLQYMGPLCVLRIARFAYCVLGLQYDSSWFQLAVSPAALEVRDGEEGCDVPS
jgi:hypothetical protein